MLKELSAMTLQPRRQEPVYKNGSALPIPYSLSRSISNLWQKKDILDIMENQNSQTTNY
jgi:hypothetical protein